MKVDGQVLGREHQLLTVNVTKVVNKISAARLAYLDGSASSSDFKLSNTEFFVPGKKVEILAGKGSDPVSLFQGIVVRQGLKVRDHTAPQLVVECRHQAVKLSVGRKSAVYSDQKDSDIIGEVLQRASIPSDVQATTVSHENQFQHQSTDWDFLLTRSEANGQFVFTNDDKVILKKLSVSASPVCSLTFGATILEMDAEIDARHQFKAVNGLTWDPAQQSVLEKAGADPGISSPGNLTPAALADVMALASYDLRHTSITEDEAQAWADAQWLKSQMCKITGRIKCEGMATVNPGDVVTLSGFGDRYNGNAVATGVRHDFDLLQGWKTHIQFGNTDKWLAEEQDVSTPKAGALLPGVNGLQIGVVTSNEDPKSEHRVRVRLPLVTTDQDGIWARVSSLDAGSDRGFFFRPEIGDEVVVGFLDDDPRQPVLLGMLHSSAKAAPLQGSDDNHEKVFQSRSKMRMYFNDDTKVIQFETPAGNRITMNEADKAIKLEDQNGNKIEMTADGIKIESSKALELKAATDLKLESGKSFGASGGTDLKLEGTSSAEISSSAMTTIKGGLVQIN